MNEKDEEKEMTVSKEELTEQEKEETLEEALDISKWTKKDWWEFSRSFITVFIIGFVLISIVIYANDGYLECWNGNNTLSVRNTPPGNYSCFICNYGSLNQTKAWNACSYSTNYGVKSYVVEDNFFKSKVMYQVGQIFTFGLIDNITLNLTGD